MASIFTDQLAAWSTLGAAVGTVLTLGFLVYQFVRNLWARDEREKRDQASRITWWLERLSDKDDRERVRDFADGASFFIDDYPDLEKAALFIRNGSEDCIYEGSLQLSELVADGSHEQYSHFLWRQLGVLPPGTFHYRVPLPFPGTPTGRVRSKGDVAFNEAVEWVEFRDRENRIWRRFGDGRLEQQPDRPANTTIAHAP